MVVPVLSYETNRTNRTKHGAVLAAFGMAALMMGCARTEADAAHNGSREDVEPTELVAEDTSDASEPSVVEPESEPLVENVEGELLPIASMTEAEINEFLLGTWNIYYPTPNENWGHRFRPNYVYRYVDHSAEAKQGRFWFTDGTWRIDGDMIQVQLSQFVMWDEDAIEIAPGFWEVPSDSGITEVRIEDDTWHTIGTIESARVGLVLTDPYTDELAEFPPTIRLRPLFQDQVRDEEVRYWRRPL